MAATQFLIRNRHCNVWYGRIVIPLKLRQHFNGKRELRKSLRTSDRTKAKRLALQFWIECQYGFDRLDDTLKASFTSTAQFVTWMIDIRILKAAPFLDSRYPDSRCRQTSGRAFCL
jgi:hypothetical protein